MIFEFQKRAVHRFSLSFKTSNFVVYLLQHTETLNRMLAFGTFELTGPFEEKKSLCTEGQCKIPV